MDLALIKKMCENRPGGIKQLASEIEMSEQNLHRCIRKNLIQASDLEKIARALNISIGLFFGEDDTNISFRQEIERLKNEIAELRQNRSPDRLHELWIKFMENQSQYHALMHEMAEMYKGIKV